MIGQTFSIANEHPPRDGMTISTPSGMAGSTAASCFSLGRETDITPESYTRPVLYIACSGSGKFLISGEEENIVSGDALIIKPNTLCGVSTEDGLVYMELMPEEEINMNKAINAGEVFSLKELVPYEKKSIVNMDIAANEKMKFVVMAFDEGTGLSPHRAPGDAMIFALEGKATIGYEGTEHTISEGENFRFAKNGLHSVKAEGRFKMALLITLE